jgi:hypothetical protein
MDGTEVVAVLSGVINLVGAIAGFFGWKHHRKAAAAAEQVERTGEAVIQGIEACEQVIKTDEAKRVKQSVQAAARAAGVEDFLHRWLVRLGLARQRSRRDT